MCMHTNILNAWLLLLEIPVSVYLPLSQDTLNGARGPEPSGSIVAVSSPSISEYSLNIMHDTWKAAVKKTGQTFHYTIHHKSAPFI